MTDLPEAWTNVDLPVAWTDLTNVDLRVANMERRRSGLSVRDVGGPWLVSESDRASTSFLCRIHPEEAVLDAGRFRSFTPYMQTHRVVLHWTTLIAGDGSWIAMALDFLKDVSGCWCFHQHFDLVVFSFSNATTAVQFKLMIS